jgi:hypothetical protein
VQATRTVVGVCERTTAGTPTATDEAHNARKLERERVMLPEIPSAQIRE